MKSAHRHELETNVLAHRLEVYIERYRPYVSRVVGGLATVVILILIWSYIAGSSATKRNEVWDNFNHAVIAMPPNLDEIHRSAQDNPGTAMQQMADVTWADGQVWMASRAYLANRQAAMDALDRATSAYQGVIQSAKNKQLIGRAHLGMGRIDEMRNRLDKARDEYGQVTGAYADYARQQIARLEKPEAQDTYAWLSTAQVPLPKAARRAGNTWSATRSLSNRYRSARFRSRCRQNRRHERRGRRVRGYPEENASRHQARRITRSIRARPITAAAERWSNRKQTRGQPCPDRSSGKIAHAGGRGSCRAIGHRHNGSAGASPSHVKQRFILAAAFYRRA